MFTANNNDVLFDDLAIISSMQLSGSSANNAIMYGDCGNRYETETSEALSQDGNSSGYKALNDCDNQLLS